MQLKAKVENKVSENVINNLLGSFIEILKLTLYGNERKMGTIHVPQGRKSCETVFSPLLLYLRPNFDHFLYRTSSL